ncbi:type II secretion system protein GspL [Sphingomonas sp. JC676]|uniref:type II secretion system protein GspL n=1 Tax=Sphingomonas sp. JC676 TaxID=2768065 RepID=UPI00292A59C2|nr:type II secretion system protein GspL [Sphingomonas sp. JC676]
MTPSSNTINASEGQEPRAAGVWTLAGDRLIIAEPDGLATILVPTEQVRLLAVDLPLSSRAKRLEALPFAIEDLIAEPVESLHLALGEEIAPKRYLVGVVRHDVMERWVDLADAGGLGQAAMVPDALALPIADEDNWSAEIRGSRVVVRTDEGGFAGPLPLLRAAWEQAPDKSDLDVTIAGDTPPEGELPNGWTVHGPGYDPAATLENIARSPLNLRQGRYAVRRAGNSTFWRRLGWIVAIGAVAHTAIAFADTMMLRSIADRRGAETLAAATLAAPGADLSGDLKATIPDLLPKGGSKAPDAFLPLLTRISGALQPLGGSLSVRQMAFEGNTLTMDVDNTDPSLAARIDAALRGAQVRATATRSPDGSIRITASAA